MSDRFAKLKWLVLLPLAAIYVASLPHAVQNLDSGEMVTSAWGLTVPHAPGYPLYVWLYHGLMVVLHAGTVFQRAALVTALCALGASAVLLTLSRTWLGVAAIAAMGTLPAIWRYAVLPDVFALNLLCAALLIAIAFAPPSTRRTIAGPVVFGLAAGNHHSIIFLAPLLVLIAWQEPRRWLAGLALAGGALLTVALYFSLMLLDTDHVNSWGELGTLRGLIRHFLRRDYGTFDLSSRGQGTHLVSIVRDLAITVGSFGLAALTVVALGIVANVRERVRAWWVLLGCLVAYLLAFLPRMNLGGDDAGAIWLRERFFVLPVLMLTALAVTARIRVTTAHHALVAVMALIAVVNGVTGDTYDLRRDVVVEEYMRNLLTTAVSQRTPAMVIVDSDTKLFAARYLRATEPRFDDVFVLPRSMTFDRRLFERAQKRWPQLYYDKEAMRTREKMDIYTQLLAPNMAAFSITHVMPFNSPRGHTTVFPVGRGLDAGTGTTIADVPPVTPTPPVYRADSNEHTDTKEVFAEYAVYYLAKGKDLLARGDTVGARKAFVDGLAIVPYCMPCLRNVCELEAESKDTCRATLEKLEAAEYDYFK